MVFRKSKCFTETHPQKPDHLKLGLSILRNPDHLEVEQIICERNHYKVLNKGTLVHLTIPN